MRKIYYIIPPTILVVCVILYFLFFSEEHHWKHVDTPAPVVETLSYEEQKKQVQQENQENAEFYNAAIEEQNDTLCDKITDTADKTECYDLIKTEEARDNKTIETCDTLNSPESITLCRDTISSDRAVESRDRIICNHISDIDVRNSCKESVDEIVLRGHIETHTVTREICDGLSSEAYKTECMAELREIDETGLYRDAITKNDISLCQKIGNTELRNTCQDTITIKGAVNSTSSNSCDTISDPDKKLYCQTQVSKTNDITLYKSAISGTDITSCNKISNTNLANKCHDTIIITRVRNEQNTTLCQDLRNTATIPSCQQIVQ